MFTLLADDKKLCQYFKSVVKRWRHDICRLLQSLSGGVGQEEAHEAAAGEQHGHDEGGRGAVRVQQRRDHHVADDAAQPRRHHRYRYTSRTETLLPKLQILFDLIFFFKLNVTYYAY